MLPLRAHLIRVTDDKETDSDYWIYL